MGRGERRNSHADPDGRKQRQRQQHHAGHRNHRRSQAEAIADQALLRGTGARGLRAIMEEVLLNTMYDLPGRTDIGKVVVDAETVIDKVNPTLVPRKAPRQRKAAS